MKFLSSASAVALLVLTTSAYADPIYVNAPNPDALALSPGPGNTLNVTSASGFGGTATYESDTGVALFGPMSFTTQPLSGTALPIAPPAPETFSFQSFSASGDVSMTIGWTQLNNLAEVELVGNATVLTSDGQFLSEYGVGTTATVEAFFPTSVCSPLVEGGNGPCDITNVTQIAFFEGADLNPDAPGGPLVPHDVPDLPEPGSSLVFLGMAVGVFLMWRNRSKLHQHRTSATAVV